MSVLYIGHCDTGCVPGDTKEFLAPYHNVAGSAALKGRRSFRDDDRSVWRRFKEVSAGSFTVNDVQQFLTNAGFLPRARQLPIFDYVTQSATRLFQEYLRTVDGVDNMVPDGFFGQRTFNHMKRWENEGKTCIWGGTGNPSAEYLKCMKMLSTAKNAYTNNRPPVLQKVDAWAGKTDTRKIADWSFDQNEIHLIGLRSGEDIGEARRHSNDIFILLINGQVFKFWGSTDPNAAMGQRSDEAFLVEGQHKYRFSWHKVSNEKKVYRALRPYQNGVLVIRDQDGDNALTAADVNRGIDKKPNHTINIHWTGVGSSNWSAGCQVIAGKSYINHLGDVVDCSSFAARSYDELNRTNKKTKGAYNMLTDLALCYAPQNVDYLLYTLGRDDTLGLDDAFSANYVNQVFDSMQV